jgi:hypothetical protein
MRENIFLGPTPIEEPCAQLGGPDYEERALKECRRYIELIRKTNGPEPEGSTARLRIVSCPHDFGTYYEVAVEYNIEDKIGEDYAYFLEENSPINWKGEGAKHWEKPLSTEDIKKILRNMFDKDADHVFDILFLDFEGKICTPLFWGEKELKDWLHRHDIKIIDNSTGTVQ